MQAPVDGIRLPIKIRRNIRILLFAFGARVPRREKTSISTRKEPRQARSSELVAAILDAAVQVLEREGAVRFTTARVAERAGVSVGSLYQYFPNKAAILFRLQSDEWRRTGEVLRDILEDGRTAPLARLRRAVHAFLRSECEEARVRVALGDAAPLYRHAPEARSAKAAAAQSFEAFMREVLPRLSSRRRSMAADVIKTTLTQVGKAFSESPRTVDETARYADGLADMLEAYVRSLASSLPRDTGRRTPSAGRKARLPAASS
jgi:AcrR family transcriptional regulator